MINNNLLDKIHFDNPWLTQPNFQRSKSQLSKRIIFPTLLNYLDKKLMISLTGLRRVGKTTLIYQLIDKLLQTKPTNQILYIQFDEDFNKLEELITYFLQNILNKDVYQAKCYIFLDELQYVNKWQVILKRFYDLNPNIQFIISGSTNLYFHRQTKESLAGRIIDLKLSPLSFHEYLVIKHQKKININDHIFQPNWIKVVKDSNILIHKQQAFEYLRRGEFPYSLQPNITQLDYNQYIYSSLLNKIFKKDVHLFDIEKTAEFSNLFKVLCSETGNDLSLENLAREVKINKKSIKKYLHVLEKMFLISLVERQEKSIRKQLSFPKKNYLASLNIVNSILGIDIPVDNKPFWGNYIETFVYNQLSELENTQINVYKNYQKKKEVDFILNNDNTILPIEIKTTNKLSSRLFGHLKYYMHTYDINRGILFYGGDTIEINKFDNKTIEVLPWWIV